MGQSQPKLKITNSAPNAVICHITDFEKKPIQQAIAPNATFTLETSNGCHTISIYPLGTTSIHGVKAETRYDFSISNNHDASMNISLKETFLTVSRLIGYFSEYNTPNSIANQTDETILAVVTDCVGRTFEQVLCRDEVYRFYTGQGKTNVSVFRPGQEDFETTYSFTARREDSTFVSISYFHWEASVKKIDGLFNIKVAEIRDAYTAKALI